MGWALGVMAAVAVWAGTAQSAAACTRVIELAMVQPTDGAFDVPTNVVPWLRGNAFGQPFHVTLRAVPGEEVPVDVEPLLGYVVADFVEVRPRVRLDAYARYELTVEIDSESGIRSSTYDFTTGAMPLEEAPPGLGALEMQVANSGSLSSCNDNTFACIALPPDTMVRATVTTGTGEPEADLLANPSDWFRYVRSESSLEQPFCVTLRARNVAGALGPPSEVCSADAATFAIATTSPVRCEGSRVLTEEGFADALTDPPPAESDAALPPTADAGPDDEPKRPSEGGCSTVPGRGPLPWPAVALLPAILVARRRRAHRRSRR